eukprot:gnl/MRDRNA2_/MRDRNA2_159623_c0_seq1.p1 gnl/MRDRNA2_/MRDRNA2_159623_c0~~gnl/MRDRNA2_/MRDRNA2_159623_c0_seq1.p1  ORF type:complete len:403 (+),score=77.67 gnl/MRDRNA2_/MRDRNA2_159623_c0_seq1:69-1277(+)
MDTYSDRDILIDSVDSACENEDGLEGHETHSGARANSMRDRKQVALLGGFWLCSVGAAVLIGRFSAVSTQFPQGAVTGNAVINKASTGTDGLSSLYNDFIVKAKHIDLTHAFSPNIPVWPGFGPATFKAAVGGAAMEGYVDKGQAFTYAEHGFQANSYEITTDQFGTQLDPPAHWNELGATISDLPPTFALRPLAVIDISGKVEKDPGYHATVEDVQDWEKKNGQVPEGSVVMIRSDWYKGWEGFKKDGLPAKYPGVTLDTLKFLHNERKILFHGHEPLDTDMTPSLEGEGWLMHHNFAQAEGVANLDKVPDAGCLLSIGYAKPLGGLGGYARFIAICPEDSPDGVSIEDAPGAPLPPQKSPLRRGDDGVMRPTPGAKPTKYCDGKSSLGCVDGKPVCGQPS